MPSPSPLMPGMYYHIHNRGNNRENLFREEADYHRFMALHGQHIAPAAETHAFCLLKNHFHFLIHTRDQGPAGSQAFSNFFNAYTKFMNRKYGRVGSLFQHPFGRELVASQPYLLQLVVYIHQNPQRHGFVDDWRDWPWSSYHSFQLPSPESLSSERQAVLDWFGGRDAFRHALSMPVQDPKGGRDL